MYPKEFIDLPVVFFVGGDNNQNKDAYRSLQEMQFISLSHSIIIYVRNKIPFCLIADIFPAVQL
jgi:hypothetical protein